MGKGFFKVTNGIKKNIINMIFSLLLFLISILGFTLNRKNIILLIICIEMMLLAATLLVLISSFNFDDNTGQTFAIYIIAVAAAETSLGLSILVAYYRLFLLFFIIFCLSYSTSYVYMVNFLNFYRLVGSQKGNNNKNSTKINVNYPATFPSILPSINFIRWYSTSGSVCNVNNKNENFFIYPSPLPGLTSTRWLGTEKPLNPWFITGLFDAESSFVVVILKNSRYKTGWSITARVQLKMHEKDRNLINQIQEFFGGVGNISKPNKR